MGFAPDRAVAGTPLRRGNSPRSPWHPASPPRTVLIIAGGARTMKPEMLRRIDPMLLGALRNFRGTVISGGTKSGIPGCVGEVAAALKREDAKQFELVGYIPSLLPADALRDERYDRIEVVPGDGAFSPGQVLRLWEDLAQKGVCSEDVLFVGFGGGRLTAVEYRVACALGAIVAAVTETGGASDEILKDPVWSASPSVLALPFEPASLRAFVTSPAQILSPEQVLSMAQCFHANYLKSKENNLPENQRPWGDKLPDTYKKANSNRPAMPWKSAPPVSCARCHWRPGSDSQLRRPGVQRGRRAHG